MSPEMWSRHDDVRFRSGAARLRNFISHPRGSAARRPGLALVREVKDSTRQVRLLPFRFSTDQTHVIEMGRAEVTGRDIGYLRFHTDGGTLLQARPDDYREPHTATTINVSNDAWTLGTHEFITGDPIVFTMEATGNSCAFNATSNLAFLAAHGFHDDEAVLFRSAGAKPPEIDHGTIYYLRDVTTDNFGLARKRGGKIIDLSTGGNALIAVMPNPEKDGNTFFINLNHTYYAIKLDSTRIKIAATRADAIAGLPLDYLPATFGTVLSFDIRVHYDYRNGSVTFDTGPPGRPFYCRKTPWGPVDAPSVNVNDHNDHSPGVLEYWVRQPGSSEDVTFDLVNDRVEWTAHGLTAGMPVTFTTTASLPDGLVVGTVYYVRNVDTDDFQVAASVPGPVIDLSGAPSGTHTAFANGIYEVPHYYAEAVLFEVNLVQSGDVLTLVHLERPVAELRRLGPTHWVLEDVEFNASVVPPTGVEWTGFAGEGNRVESVTAVPLAVLTTAADHTLNVSEKVMVTGVGDISDGHYIVNTAPTIKTLTLKEFETGNPVGSGITDVTASSRVRPSGFIDDWLETYAVTALDADDEESPASETVTANNNLLVPGAYNRISWEPSAGALRYRVYKEVNGLLGFIGEVDAPTLLFTDDNIGPDLSITPPIVDGALRATASCDFDTVKDLVLQTAHGLEAGAPVIFDTDGTLPEDAETSASIYGITYYVFNPSEDDYQLTTTPTGTVSVNLLDPPVTGLHTAITGAFPSAVAYFEQRRVFGGALLRPQDFWMTASSTESDLSYSIPTKDSNRIHNRVAARERSQIRHAVPIGHLLLLSSAAEYRITPLNNDALTPGSVAARAPTHVGVSPAAPVVVNNAILFPAARGGHVREMGFSDQVRDYVTGDVSLRAAHFFDDQTVVQMAYQQAPQPVVWAVSSSGSLLGFSYVPEEQIAGWHEHDIDGAVESCAVVAEGTEDHVYIVANRGGTRYVERMGDAVAETVIADAFFVDSGVTYDGTAVSEVFVPHLAGQAVVFLADGIVGSGTVSAGGMLTLVTAASKVHVGLSYDSELRTLPIGMQLDAALGSGRTKNVNRIWLRIRSSGAFESGPSLQALVDSVVPPSGQLLTALVPFNVLGSWGEEGQIYVRQSDPLPLIVTGLTLEVASGG